MKAAAFRKHIEEDGVLKSVRRIVPGCPNEKEAQTHVQIYVQTLLDANRYAVAALVLWGDRIFDPRPESIRQCWRGISKNAKFLAQGGGALGKSYSLIAWLLLDWWRDPQYTAVKLISTTAGHAKANTFATMTMLHREACIPMPGGVFSEHIGLEATDKRACISVVKIPMGDDGKGRLQGFHPIPRPKPHPTLGRMSRIRVLIDEAEETPVGVWFGIENLCTTIDGTETIKISAAYNPVDIGSKVAQLAEPKQGWENITPEKDTAWESRYGWHVERLDGARCENVKQKKLVYDGLQTWDGYRGLETNRGGNTPQYWTFGRGWYPPNAMMNNVIAPEWLSQSRGAFAFSGPTMRFAGDDIAVEGRDENVLTVGRFGLAVSFQHESGAITKFKEPRMAAQVDQQIVLDKGSTRITAHAIRDNCKAIQIPPGNVDLDRTGNGATIHDLLCEPEVWSPDVMGTDFNKNATDTKILEQDKEIASELYSGIVTEVWFALARWMEAGYIAISPGVCRDRLNGELLGRKYKLVGKLYRVVPKDEFKLQLGYSPDFADSLTLFLNAIRKRTSAKGSMTGHAKRPKERPAPIHGTVDTPKYMDWSEDGV